MSDLYRIFAFTQRENVGFNYVDIPDDLNIVEAEAFDPVAMNALFEAGYQLGLSQDPWKKAPPGFSTRTVEESETSLP